MQLTIAPESKMAEQARQLIARVQAEESPLLPRQDIIEMLTTIAVYKFVDLSREEVETMLGVNLEDTKVGREMKAEGRLEVQLEMVPKLVSKGLSIEEIADLLELPIEDVRKALTDQA